MLRGFPGLGEVINNLSSCLVWQMTLLFAFPWHRVCPRWVFGLFSAFSWSGFLVPARLGGSNWHRGSPQRWGVVENLPRFFLAYFGFDFHWVFFWSVWFFIFPSQPGWEDTKPREQNGHTRPFCANAAVPATRGRFCPSSRSLKILLEIQGPPDFPLGNPSLSLACFGSCLRKG